MCGIGIRRAERMTRTKRNEGHILGFKPPLYQLFLYSIFTLCIYRMYRYHQGVHELRFHESIHSDWTSPRPLDNDCLINKQLGKEATLAQT